MSAIRGARHQRRFLAAIVLLAVTVLLPAGLFSPAPARAVSASDVGDGNTDAASAPGTARDDVWPKPVDEFLAGEYLTKSDVILTRRSGDIASTIIRWATNSIFSHAALIYTSPPFDPGISGTFVIEAGTGGVDLTKLTDYSSGNNADFVAVRRLKPNAWFTPERQARVRGVLLDKIKANYDFWTIWKITRNLWFGVQTKMADRQTTVERYRKNDWAPPNEYICTGLVQIGFVEMLVEAIRRGEIPPEALRDVVFNKTAEGYLPEPGNWQYLGDDAKETAINFRDILNDELYSVTPEDLAQTDKLTWQYLIRKGAVYKVSSYADVLKIVNQ